MLVISWNATWTFTMASNHTNKPQIYWSNFEFIWKIHTSQQQCINRRMNATNQNGNSFERKNQHIGRIIAYIFESLAVNQLIQAIAIDTVQFLFPSLPFCTVCREAFRPINANFSCAYVLECIVLWMNLYQPKKTLEKASTLFKLLIEKFIRSITSLSFIWRAKKKKSYD